MPWNHSRPYSALGGGSRDSRLLAKYAFDWLNPAMGYAFMRSTTPHKLVVDMEVHASSCLRLRNASIPSRHMGAALMVAHLHGLSMSLMWSWARVCMPMCATCESAQMPR